MTINPLAEESSPYLQQHANNPVQWYPWGQVALQKALTENKPILLSIGYAACHWCHVMAHESFEDEATAALMNELFINIKVDREERPDLDKIYQTAHQILSQQNGGWPLTIFLSPNDLVPFFSGTYFPKEPRYQLPAFKELLTTLADIYKNKSTEIHLQNTELLRILTAKQNKQNVSALDQTLITQSLTALAQNFDQENGGFGHAPKFPQASILKFLIAEQSAMGFTTLTQMAMSGIYDQLNGGFYRYTVDAQWRIPHFEKMLYDNGQLLYLYALADQQKPNDLYSKVIHKTAAWALNEIQSPEGGYYSSFNADSDGHEGKYYIFDKQAIKNHLTPDEFSIAQAYFGLDHPANFENQWHFYIDQPLDQIASHLNISLSQAEELLKSAQAKLLTLRNEKNPPSCDKKILTSWNALMIKGMLKAGVSLNEPTFIESAFAALDYIKKTLWVKKSLFATNSKTPIMAYLDDYVFLLDAVLASLQTQWHTDNLTFAIELADNLLENFEDKELGGFYFTATNHEKLIYRPKHFTDDAIPSGNGVAVQVLLLLGYFTGETRYLDAAVKTLEAASHGLANIPDAHCELLLGLQMYLTPPKIVIIRGPQDEVKNWQARCANVSNALIFAIADSENTLPLFLSAKKSNNTVCAYVCQGLQCSNKIEELGELLGLLQKSA